MFLPDYVIFSKLDSALNANKPHKKKQKDISWNMLVDTRFNPSHLDEVKKLT